MIYQIINSVLPVAILVLLGFIATKRNTFTYDQSLALLKYVGVIAVPVLTFKMIVTVNLNDINWLLLFSYVSSEICIYMFAGLIAKYIFKLEWTEAILIATADTFSNHILFMYPIVLFAAGIILAHQIEKTQKNISNLIIIFKILLHPLLAIFIIWTIHDISFDISETTIMVASAPVGLMALIFSTQYGVKPNAISVAILITTILSIITIPLSGSLS